MTPAPSAGSEGTKKKRRRKRPSNRSPQSPQSTTPGEPKKAAPKSAKSKPPYAKRVDEVSAGGLVVDTTGKLGLLIGRRDIKDGTGKRIL